MGRSRFKFQEEHYPYFITSTIIEGIPLFSDPEVAGIVLNSLEFIQKEFKATIYGFVIMENHIHVVLQSPKISDLIRSFKSYTAKKIIESLEIRGRKRLLKKLKFSKRMHKHQSQYQVWQEGVHPKQIDSYNNMVSLLSYIHNNPVKAGYVDDPIHWRYSSAKNYELKTGLIDIRLFER